MEGNIATIVNSVSHNIMYRDILGVKAKSSFSIYNMLMRYIDYCLSREEIIYRNYAKDLMDKLELLERRCGDIRTKKVKDIEDMTLPSKVLHKPLGDISISYKEIMSGFSGMHPATKIHLESDQYLFNGKGSVLLSPFSSIKAESKYVYIPYTPTSVIEVAKKAHDTLTSIGYSIFDYNGEEVRYYHGDSKLALKAKEMPLDKAYSIIKATVISYDQDVRHISNTCIIKVIHDIIHEAGSSVSSEVTEDIYLPRITSNIESMRVRLPLSGYEIDIKDFYDITYISRFLTVKSNKVSLSKEYTYDVLGDRIIAIPLYVLALQDRGFRIEDATPTKLTLSKLKIDGNKDIEVIDVFDITTSLFLKYRIKESGKEPSDESSIIFYLDTHEDNMKSVNNTVHIW